MLIWIAFGTFAALSAAALWLKVSGLAEIWRSWRIRRRTAPLTLQIINRSELSDDTFALALAPRHFWHRLPPYLPGQHVVLHIPAGNGKTTRRAYSLSAWQRRPSRYELGIKREPDGTVSRWLYDCARIGRTLSVTAPQGSFHASDVRPPSEAVLIAGGIGITPMRAMLMAFAERPSPPRVMLHFSARTRSQLHYQEEFERLGADCSWFSYYPRLTQAVASWSGATGRITADAVMAPIGDKTRAQIFICANRAMEDSIIQGLLIAGVDRHQIHRESFGVAAPPNEIQARITFRGESFTYDGAPTLLHALLDRGFDIPAECRAGECGSCRLTLIRGTARNLLSGEQETGSILTCCAVPASDDLDLA